MKNYRSKFETNEKCNEIFISILVDKVVVVSSKKMENQEKRERCCGKTPFYELFPTH
jgi:hypothetical protein